MRYRGFRYRHGSGGGSTGGGPVGSTSHPSLLITASGASPTVPELQARLASTGVQSTLFQKYVDIFCSKSSNGGYLDNPLSMNVDDGLPHYAFLIATYPVPGVNYRDVSTLADLDTPFFTMFDSVDAGNSTSGYGSPRWAAFAMAYDWGFSRLNSTRKQAAVTYLKKATDDLSAGPLHHRRAVEALQYHFAGYVFDGDGIDDSTATSRIALRASHVTANGTGIRTAQSFVAGTVGGEASGVGYWLTQLDWHGMGQLMYADAYRTKTGDASGFATGVESAFEYYAQWIAYLLAPYKITYGGGGDIRYVIKKSPQTQEIFTDATNGDFTSTFIAPYLMNIARVYASTNSTQAALAKWLLETLFTTSGLIFQGAGDPRTEHFALWGNYLGYNTVTSQSPSALNLPIAKHFNPFGLVVIRDGWAFDGSNSVVQFIAAPYMWTVNNFGQTWTGGFSVDRRGPLVIFPGGGAHSPLQESGYGGATVIFPKPAETGGGLTNWDKGGARVPGNFSTPFGSSCWSTGTQWDIGGLKPDTGKVDLTDGTSTHAYSYIYADLSRAYNGPQNQDNENSSKVLNFERQLVRIPPASVGVSPGYTIIYDRTNTVSSAVEQRWLLYPAASTTIGAKTMTISNSSATGTTTRNSVVSTNYDGTGGTIGGTISYTNVLGVSAKGFWTPLLPANCRIIERGGPNSSGEGWNATSQEWEDPYGVPGGDVPSLESEQARMFAGAYRYELLARDTSTNTAFLNVIEDVETSASARSTCETLIGSVTTGVRVSTAVVAIFKTSTGTMSSGSFVVGTSGTYDVLVANLSSNHSYTFVLGGNITSLTHIGTSNAGLTYTSNPHGVLWMRAVVGAGGSGAGNTISFA